MVNGISNITDIQSALTQTGQATLASIVTFIPGLIAAILVFLLGWVIALLISRIFGRLLKIVKFEQFLKEQKVNQALGTVVISTVLTKILYYYIIIWFVSQAFEHVNLGAISDFIKDPILLYLPKLIGAALLVVSAALIGEFIKMRIMEVGRKSATVHFLARASKAILIFLGLMSGLKTAEIEVTIIENTFVVLAAAIFFGLALAFGLAFGLGSQGEAKEVVRTLRKRFRV